MLSRIVEEELFNIQYRVGDMVIAQISEEIEKFLLSVNRVENNDFALTFYFGRNETYKPLPVVEGELRIDRLGKMFEIIAKCNDWYVVPAYGDWVTVHDYLSEISREQE